MRILHWYPNFLGGGGVANKDALELSAQRIAREYELLLQDVPTCK